MEQLLIVQITATPVLAITMVLLMLERFLGIGIFDPALGSDRVREFETIINKYNNVKSRHGFYNFENVNVVSAGERDPDAEGATGMSASKMRAAAAKADLASFKKGLPSGVDADKLMKQVRKGLKVKHLPLLLPVDISGDNGEEEPPVAIVTQGWC